MEGKYKLIQSRPQSKEVQGAEKDLPRTCVVKTEGPEGQKEVQDAASGLSIDTPSIDEGRTKGGLSEVESTSKVLESIKKEVIDETIDDETNPETKEEEDQEKEKQLTRTPDEVKKEKTEVEENEKSEESDMEEMEEIAFVCSEEPLLDVYEVEGRPHRYCLLREVTRRLGVSRRELIIAAKNIETLEVSPEEFESRVHSSVLGMPRRRVAGPRVELIRLTGVLERLLGLETVCV